MEWEWRVVSLKDMFPGELLTLCVREKDVGPDEVLGGWRDAEATAESRADRSRGDDGGGGGGAQGDSQPTRGGGTEREMERVPIEAGTRGSRMSLWPSRPCRGNRGPSVLADVGREKTPSTSMLSPPPHRQAPPLSVGCGSRHTGRVRSRRSWERGKQQDRPGLWVWLPERQFPAESAVGQWAWERLQCGEWDAWLRDVRACLPKAPPGLLERHLIQFLDWGPEAARDLRQPDFLPLIATALSSLDSGAWESLLHDSTSPKLLMQHIRDEVLSRVLGVFGHNPIPADIWERCVTESFASVASCHLSGAGSPSDEAVVMLTALRSQNLLFPLPPGSPGPNGGVFAIPKTLDKCSLIVNLVPVNREMPEKPEKFSLPSVEVLALLVQVAQQGSSFPPPPLYIVGPDVSGQFGRCWGSPGGGGGGGVVYVPY